MCVIVLPPISYKYTTTAIVQWYSAIILMSLSSKSWLFGILSFAGGAGKLYSH